MKGLIGRKVGMNQMFDEKGNVTPVTLISLGPCVVMDIKTIEKSNYSALKLCYEEQKEKRIKKPLLGQFKKAKISPAKTIKEIRFNNDKEIEQYSIGDKIDLSIFEENKPVKVTGITKGKGFAGVMKRWHFKGAPASHGAHENHRGAGSVGAGTDPGRVVPGKKMPGHMGNAKMTVKNLQLMKIDTENSIIAVKGAIPGCTKSLVIVRQD